MKLLNCLKCNDIVELHRGMRSCLCGASSGKYLNDRFVEYSGPSRILGMRGEEYLRAVEGRDYKWFIIPQGNNTRKIDEARPNPEENCPHGDISPQDIEDAVTYYNETYELPHVENVWLLLQQITCISPEELGDDPEHLGHEEAGWLKNIPQEQWLSELEREFDRDFSHILGYWLDKKMPPAIRINDLFGDGRARAIFHYAIGEKMPVADFVYKKPKYLYHATYRPALKSIKKYGLGAPAPKKILAYDFSVPGVTCFSRSKDVAKSFAETSEDVPEEWLDQIVVLKVALDALQPSKLSIDPNIQADLPEGISWQYSDTIPWSEIRVLK